MHALSVTLLAWIWFALTGVSVLYAALDIFARARATTMTKVAWLLVILYTGPFALLAYFLAGRLRRETSPSGLTKSIGATIHCLAGDATGILLSAAVTRALRLPMGIDALFEYLAGFSVGLFVFQALIMRRASGGGYTSAVRRTWFMEWVSMNAVMAGMIPVMIVSMTHDERAMNPASVRFWGVMSAGTLAGALLALPINVWLGRAASSAHKAVIAVATIAMLAAGASVAAAFGDFSMR